MTTAGVAFQMQPGGDIPLEKQGPFFKFAGLDPSLMPLMLMHPATRLAVWANWLF